MEAPPSLLPHVDELVMEYLLFRGFTKSFQVFSAERKRDRAKGFDVEQIIAQLLSHVQTYEIDAVLETWRFLSARFFSHLDASYAATIASLERSLLRLFVVNAIKTNEREHAIAFFQRFISFTEKYRTKDLFDLDCCSVDSTCAIAAIVHASTLNAQMATSGGDDPSLTDSWCRWFILPFLPSPETDAYFQVFFTNDWLDAVVTSLRNFLAHIFRHMALPKLLALQLTRLEEPALKMRLRVSQSECNRLRLFNVEANARIQRLEAAGQQLHRLVRRMVQHSYVEHFAATTREPPVAAATPSTGSIGLSAQQLQELGALFGIHSSDSTSHGDATAAGAIPRMAEHARRDAANGVDDSVDATSSSDSLTRDHDDVLPSPSDQSSVDQSSVDQSSVDQSSPGGHVVGSTDSVAASVPSRLATLSLVRRRDCSAGAASTLPVKRIDPFSAAPTHTLSRVSTDGHFVALAPIGSYAIAIWSLDDSDSAAPTAIQLLAPLTTMTWLVSSDQSDQRLLYGLADGSLNVWGMRDCTLLTRTSQQIQILDAVGSATGGSCLELLQRTVWRMSNRITSVATDAAASVFATVSDCGRIDLYDAKLRHPMRTWRAVAIGDRRSSSDDPVDAVRALAMAPDGLAVLSLAATGSGSTSVLTITEWACADDDDAVATRVDAASTDSSGDAADDPTRQSAPPIRCTYDVVDTFGMEQNGESDSSSAERLQHTLQFHATGRQFVLVTRTQSQLVRVSVYKRGDPRPHAVDLQCAPGETLVDFDWTSAETPPLCSTRSSTDVVALWQLSDA